jgi:hypothetical protein
LSVARFVTASGSAAFEGIERDLLMTIIRPGKWDRPVGGNPKFNPLHFGTFLHPEVQAFDQVEMEFTLWTSGANAALIESYMPPYAPGAHFDLWLPGTSTSGAVPGFGWWDSTNSVWVLKNCTIKIATMIESMGRKAPIVDLFGYRMTVRFCASVTLWGHENERGRVVPTFSVTVPNIMGRKFVAHQIQDVSSSMDPLPNRITPVYAVVQHGRGRDMGMVGDHVDIQTMDAWVTWFRAIRGSSFALTSPGASGPGQPDTVNMVATGMKINRVAGYWECKLDLSLAA